MRLYNKYTADFETSTEEWLKIDDSARVWAYSLCEINNPNNFLYGNNIEDFIKWCSNPKENYTLYFHNLKYDSEYIINYLLQNGYELIYDKEQIREKTIYTLITDMGAFYSLEIYFEYNAKKINKVTIYDSLKILNFSVEEIAKNFDLPIRKLDLDYDLYRPVGYKLNLDEIMYIKNDVEIMARALKICFDMGIEKMTIASSALNEFKKMKKKSYKCLFPHIETDLHLDINKSYRGGFTYLNPIYKEKISTEGVVFDVNSLYPSVMRNCKLPFGNPIYFEGEYKEDRFYPLYIQNLSCSFKLKKNKIPTIQLKNCSSFMANEYIESSKGEILTLTLTNIDLKLFLDQYDIDDLIYHYGYKFQSIGGLFTEYIDKWTESKIKAKKDKNKPLYQISKLFLNSLYGKFATYPFGRCKYPYIEDGITKYKIGDRIEKSTIYIPVGTFITSYAREKTIRTSQAIRDYSLEKYGVDKYVYSDTDSIHCLFKSRELEDGSIDLYEDRELYDMIEIDDYKLGAWKVESRFIKGKYLRQKCYIELGYDDKLNVTVAGLPKKLGKYVTFENFKPGFTIKSSDLEKEHKLTYKHVKGGVVLAKTDFTIK